MGKAVQSLVKNNLTVCRKKCIFLGVTNQAISMLAQTKKDKSFLSLLEDYATIFPIIEWRTDLQTLVDEALLKHLSGIGLHTVFIQVPAVTKDFQNGRLFSDYWCNFVGKLKDLPSRTLFKIILSIDRTTVFSTEVLDAFCTISDAVYPIKVYLECEHRSWKNPTSLKIFREARINIVQKDTPSLSGFTFLLQNYDRKASFLRLMGRNKVTWFSSEADLRFQYDYSKEELSQLSAQIKLLREDCDEVFVIAANRPAQPALSNILELAHLLVND
jgi:hypothetical protein